MQPKFFSALLVEDEYMIKQNISESIYNIFEKCDPIMYCAKYNKPKSLRICLEYASKNQIQCGSHNKITALMMATMTNAIDCAKHLLFQLRKQTEKGVTALMLAALYNRTDMMKYLLSEVQMKTFVPCLNFTHPCTALQIALKYKSRDAAELLLPQEIAIDYETNIDYLIKNEWLLDEGFNQGLKILVNIDTLVTVASLTMKEDEMVQVRPRRRRDKKLEKMMKWMKEVKNE